MTYSFTIPTPEGPKILEIEQATSLYFVGANGGGKTRLAVKIEQDLGATAHRISAHRALNLNPEVPKLSSNSAIKGLKFGISMSDPNYGLHNRAGSRWGSKAAVVLLNDYDFLIQSLFAEQSNTALETHKSVRAGSNKAASKTSLEKLAEIWDRLLPHRKLSITGDNIEVLIAGKSEKYPASEMSDGERAVFYLIGQVLMAEKNSVLIFDEPELHIHRSIVSRLWDELEAARIDCGMVLISHDLEFVASRKGQKFVIRSYEPNSWTVEAVPEESGFTEELTTLILGSRKPVLFVEGRNTSLDRAIYRACYPHWTVVSRSSCEEVIHSVVTMRANAALTRVTCSGIVDADGQRASDEVDFLNSKGIAVLPVSEIENLFMLPNVVEEILKSEGFSGEKLTSKRDELLEELFASATNPANQLSTVMRYCQRKIDRTLKKIDLSRTNDIAGMAAEYAAKTGDLDITAISASITSCLKTAISNKDAAELLKWYDNKGLLSIASKAKSTKKDSFEQWVIRAMQNDSAPALRDAIKAHLPAAHAT